MKISEKVIANVSVSAGALGYWVVKLNIIAQPDVCPGFKTSNEMEILCDEVIELQESTIFLVGKQNELTCCTKVFVDKASAIEYAQNVVAALNEYNAFLGETL